MCVREKDRKCVSVSVHVCRGSDCEGRPRWMSVCGGGWAFGGWGGK